MHILYFTRDYTSHDHRFLSALAGTEHQVSYLRLERSQHQVEDRSLPSAIEQVQWQGGKAPVRLKDGLRLLLDLKRVIRQVKPDIILAGPLQRTAFPVALAGYQPLISMSWGYDLIQDANRSAWWRWATRYTLKRSTVMVGDCSTIRSLAVSFGMPTERIVTFPWGIDLKHFSPPDHFPPVRSPAASPAPFTILSTRSWEPIYGVDLIARAFVQAAAQRPELRLVMLGNGSQAGKLRQIFGERRFGQDDQPTVIFPGQVKYADLPRFYRQADIYVSASHSDGTSISLLEAMACGMPVLVSDIPGNREWVSQGQQGWLFPDGDVKALADAIVQAVDQRTLLPEMGQAARQLTEQRANWDKNFPHLLQAFELALSHPL
ncbi:MAG: glycosyltransferase [Anaerolineales bacterium]|nr:glycosyltransferase [Anaerolineales bacterium]